MRIKRKTSDEERLVLVGMAFDANVLARIAAKWHEGGLFAGRAANLIGQWCVDYHAKYDKAPGEALESVFTSWSESVGDTGLSKTVALLLDDVLDGKSDNVDSEYVLDVAGKHFKAVALETLADRIKGDLDVGNVDRAASRVVDYGPVELGQGAGIDLLTDEDAISAAFATVDEPLIEYPGALGEFFGSLFDRDAFVAFLGSVNVGKSWWLLDVAWRAIRERLRVAFFEVGDMSQSQVIRRFMVRIAHWPMREGVVKKPVEIVRVDEDNVKVRHKNETFDSPLSESKAWRACQRVMRGKKGSYLKLSVHPSGSLNADGLRAIVAEWERVGWVPDVVVIDYADLLAPRPGIRESRERINDTWKCLRRLSQEIHGLVVTATQADAASYTARLITKTNFSETRQKIDHVTAMIGLNRTMEDEEKGYYRLNLIKLREGEYRTGRVVYVADCLPLGNPAVKSCF